jgi:hypothetical protein
MRYLNLLWALPLAVLFQCYSFVAARLAWCGLRDCHGPGSSLNEPLVGDTFVAFSIGVILSTVVLVLAPWTKRVRLRLIAPPVFSILFAIAGFIMIAAL